MKLFICLALILLLATQIHAVTYSWVDDSGTYNYTEDYSRVPKKYQKNVKRLEDVPQEVKPPQAATDPVVKPPQIIKTDERSAAVPEGESEMYGGKSRAAWRKELDALEAEMLALEQRIEPLTKEFNTTKVVSRAQFDEQRKEYEEYRAAYQQKYKNYLELIEAIRKAGIPVGIKK